MVHYFLNFTAYKAVSGRVFFRCGILSLGYNCTSWPCAKMVPTENIIRICNPIVDLSKFIFNKKILSKVVVLSYN